MAHFARVVNGRVTQVIVAEQEFVDAYDICENGKWIQTSYNTKGNVHYGQNNLPDSGTPLRKNYAVVGGQYDKINDAFYSPQPFSSWELNTETYLWEAPKPVPNTTDFFVWDEETQSWIL